MYKPPLHGAVKKALLHGASNPVTVQEKTSDTLKCTSDYAGLRWSFDVALYSGCVVYVMEPSVTKCLAFYDKDGKDADLHKELENACSTTGITKHYEEDSYSFDDPYYSSDEDYENVHPTVNLRGNTSEETSKKKVVNFDMEGWNVWVRVVRPKAKKNRK